MSPRRKHGGGRPRSPQSVLDFAERWGISEKAAPRLCSREIPEEALAILVAESKRCRAAQMHFMPSRGKYVGGLRALGMKSRVPGVPAPCGAGMRGALSASRREHMQVRAKERFGLDIGKLARRTLIRKVQAGEVKFARRLTCSRTVIVAEYGGVEVTFIYSGQSKGILTFLPPDACETAAWREGKRGRSAECRSAS